MVFFPPTGLAGRSGAVQSWRRCRGLTCRSRCSRAQLDGDPDLAPTALALAGARDGTAPAVVLVGWFGRGWPRCVFGDGLEEIGQPAASQAVAVITTHRCVRVLAHGASADPLAGGSRHAARHGRPTAPNIPACPICRAAGSPPGTRAESGT